MGGSLNKSVKGGSDLERKSFVDIAIKRMKQHIANGNWQPGDKYLSEKELVGRLGVSRTVIREALISLQSIGVLKVVTGDGIYIANSSIEPVKEILKHHHAVHGVKLRELAEIRKVIELGAIRLIIEKNLPINLSHAYEINDDYNQAIEQQADTRKADRLFHQWLIKSTGNETFYQFSEVIQEYFTLTKLNIIQGTQALKQSYQEHHNIIKALESKEMKKAQSEMSQHLEPVIVFTKQLEEEELDGTH